MSTTYIQVRCSKCGYTHRAVKHGYMTDPIGIPLMQCPSCKAVSRCRDHKEWIQMSPIRKYFAISPRGIFGAVFLAMIPALILARHGNSEALAAWALRLYPLFWLVFHYILVSIRVNCDKFLCRMVPSVKRTRNEDYRKLLANFGKLYSEDIPKFVLVKNETKKAIALDLKRHKVSDFEIPSLAESVESY